MVDFEKRTPEACAYLVCLIKYKVLSKNLFLEYDIKCIIIFLRNVDELTSSNRRIDLGQICLICPI